MERKSQVSGFSEFLVSSGTAIRDWGESALDGIAAAAVWVSDGLNPLLSGALSLLNPICNAIGSGCYAVLGVVPPWFGITLISVVLGIVMLVAFGKFSNQERIGRAKDDIKANLLALKLFKDELGVVFSAQVKILWAICRLQRYVLTPVLLLTPPMLLLLAQMGVRYQWRPLEVGEVAIVEAALSEEANGNAFSLSAASGGVAIEAGPVAGDGTVAWRVLADEPGRYELSLKAGGESVTKELVVGRPGDRVSALRPAGVWYDQLLHPVERALPANGAIRSIELSYPPLESYVYGSDWWILYFFVVSMATALVFKPFFKVRF